jgi:rhodanese-related sulfurtransferase
MTVDEVEKGIAANTLTAIDCNGDDTRKKHGVLPGAVLISDDEAYAPSELPADKSRKLVFYCSGPS